MTRRRKQRLLLVLGLLLLGGLLLSGGVHSVLHADDGAPCDACLLSGVTPVDPVPTLDPTLAVCEVAEPLWSAPAPHPELGACAPRGPPPRS